MKKENKCTCGVGESLMILMKGVLGIFLIMLFLMAMPFSLIAVGIWALTKTNEKSS